MRDGNGMYGNPMVTVHCEVFPDGQEVTALVLEYGCELVGDSLVPSLFSISDVEIIQVYTSNTGIKRDISPTGTIVVLELASGNPRLATIVMEDARPIRRIPDLLVRQVGDLVCVGGQVLHGSFSILAINKERQALVDEFENKVFYHPLTKEALRYSLYVPSQYDATRKYPLIVFIHDRGVCSHDQPLGLVQGIGGIIWVSDEEQREHESFVLVPQYTEAMVNDSFQVTSALEVTEQLITSLQDDYSLDERRIYGTGQSMGCMSLMEMGIRNPGLFTGLLLVAGQWDPSRIEVLSRTPIWAFVAQGDTRAFVGMNSCMDALEAAGASVTRVYWNGKASAEQAEQQARDLLLSHVGILYTVYEGNSVVPTKTLENSAVPLMLKNHMATWRKVYQIKAVRDWLWSLHT